MHNKILQRRAAPLMFVWLVLATLSWGTSLQCAPQYTINGNERIEKETILSYIDEDILSYPEDTQADQILKNLFQTGFFKDISVQKNGQGFLIQVSENPVINRIAFEGNLRIKDVQLAKEIDLKPRAIYTQSRIQDDIDRLTEVYRRNGRFAVRIEPKLIEQPQNRVDLVFEIQEGSLTTVKKINFIGNDFFSDSTLRDELLTKEVVWYRFLSSNDTYDPDRLNFDKQLLENFYKSHGFADFKIISTLSEFSQEDEKFYITFTIEEGDIYNISTVDIKSNVYDLDTTTLQKAVSFSPGDKFNAEEINNSITDLTSRLADLGYAFADIQPQFLQNREEKTIGLTFQIEEGPRVYVEKINITGNVRTKDNVIRREVLLVEGDAFNRTLMKNSQRNITNLNYFQKVDIQNVEGSQPDLTIVNIDITEKSTGELGFRAGFSTGDGALAGINLNERNLLGTGQRIGIDTTISQKSQRFSLSYAQPHFLDTNITAGVGAFHTITDNKDESSFTIRKTGATLSASYPFFRDLNQSWLYTLQLEDLKADSGAPLAVKNGEKKLLRSMLTHILTQDKLDNRLNPREGYLVQLKNEFSGLGGDIKYFKNQIKAEYYIPLAKEVVGSLSASYGHMANIGDEDIRVSDRFFLGNQSLRGFKSAGIGPRDRVTGDALGGKQFAAASLEVVFPIGLPNELGIRGAAFVDAGTIMSPEEEGSNIINNESIRASAGVGILWNSPMGVIRTDFSFPFLKEDEDEEQFFSVQFGTNF